MTDFSVTNTNLKVSDVYGCLNRGSKQRSFLRNINVLNLNGADTKFYKTLENPVQGSPGLPNTINMYNPYDDGINAVNTYFESFDTNVNTNIYVYRITNIPIGLGSVIHSIKFTDVSENPKTLKCLMFMYKLDNNDVVVTNDHIWTNSITDIATGNYTPVSSNIDLNHKNIYNDVSTNMTESSKIFLDVITTSENISLDICYTSCYGDVANEKFN